MTLKEQLLKVLETRSRGGDTLAQSCQTAVEQNPEMTEQILVATFVELFKRYEDINRDLQITLHYWSGSVISRSSNSCQTGR